MDITEFPSGVIEHLGWYVYRLIDPRDGSTFYVGKGKGNRVFAHMRGEVAATDDDELLSNKLKQIREIRLIAVTLLIVAPTNRLHAQSHDESSGLSIAYRQRISSDVAGHMRL